jgi:hypothetical protein
MRIDFTRSGGFTGIPLRKTLDTDTLPAEEGQELQRLVDGADFFGLPEMLRSGGADKRQYKITIERDGKTHAVEMDERAIPATLKPLVTKLETAARNR